MPCSNIEGIAKKIIRCLKFEGVSKFSFGSLASILRPHATPLDDRWLLGKMENVKCKKHKSNKLIDEIMLKTIEQGKIMYRIGWMDG
jgi:hypothetical protein